MSNFSPSLYAAWFFGSVAKAGLELGYRPGSFYSRIYALEKEAGERLFERQKRPFQLTLAGESLISSYLNLEQHITRGGIASWLVLIHEVKPERTRDYDLGRPRKLSAQQADQLRQMVDTHTMADIGRFWDISPMTVYRYVHEY